MYFVKDGLSLIPTGGQIFRSIFEVFCFYFSREGYVLNGVGWLVGWLVGCLTQILQKGSPWKLGCRMDLGPE